MIAKKLWKWIPNIAKHMVEWGEFFILIIKFNLKHGFLVFKILYQV